MKKLSKAQLEILCQRLMSEDPQAQKDRLGLFQALDVAKEIAKRLGLALPDWAIEVDSITTKARPN